MAAFKDLTGKTFGKLTVIGQTGETKYGNRVWKCVCECGNYTDAFTAELNSGHKQTCGNHSRSVGFVSKSTRLYRTWQNMKNRCYWEKDKSFRNYGGRGIRVCEEWKNSFSNFREWALRSGYKDNLTIDRINTNGDYSPENCRWATIKQQENNKRNNHRLEFNGITKTISEWAEALDIPKQALSNRIKAGWPVEEALTRPLKNDYRR